MIIPNQVRSTGSSHELSPLWFGSCRFFLTPDLRLLTSGSCSLPLALCVFGFVFLLTSDLCRLTSVV